MEDDRLRGKTVSDIAAQGELVLEHAIGVCCVEGQTGLKSVVIVAWDDAEERPKNFALTPAMADKLAKDLRMRSAIARAHNDQRGGADQVS